MDAIDPKFLPNGFGLYNTGAICYLNSLLQMLASCTAFTRAVIANCDYVKMTLTGRAVLEFVLAYGGASDVTMHSSRILDALVTDMRRRRPGARFGVGQESASEALVHLLDMMEPEKEGDAKSAPPVAAESGKYPSSIESPITRLFLHRFRCDLHCRACRKRVSSTTEHMICFNMFKIDRLKHPPNDVKSFSDAVRLDVSAVSDYECPGCHRRTDAYRVYRLSMVPEIIVCSFNQYNGFGGGKRMRYFPNRIEMPASAGGMLQFILVGQVEHSGGLDGGHYWARGLRSSGICLLNDTSVSPSAFQPTPGTYLVAYHYIRHVLDEQPS